MIAIESQSKMTEISTYGCKKEHTCRCDGCATNMKCYPEEVTFREFISGIL